MSEITVTFSPDEATAVRLALSVFASDRRLSARSCGSVQGFEEAESRAQAEESTANAGIRADVGRRATAAVWFPLPTPKITTSQARDCG